jgi:hypothetical protein
MFGHGTIVSFPYTWPQDLLRPVEQTTVSNSVALLEASNYPTMETPSSAESLWFLGCLEGHRITTSETLSGGEPIGSPFRISDYGNPTGRRPPFLARSDQESWLHHRRGPGRCARHRREHGNLFRD